MNLLIHKMSEITIEKVYLAQRATDLRKSIDGLANVVKEEVELNPFPSCLLI
ncbi:IS66 family insertion sequence element accessory protein TnpB [Bacillus paramycoides]|uniref:IS66 family insertion sequence element accessory protein TnpB n=1 Tax=Bacillus cereus group TaxID=86661 RepID=UPI002E22E342|nr:IS66 family insertion sequence element accessory protein TnpB [Bacillus paramycoides]MED1116085.1 IS66 family insertion sequence element accessory protein TnpB [Bacillus paramycoides]